MFFTELTLESYRVPYDQEYLFLNLPPPLPALLKGQQEQVRVLEHEVS